jgi:predicted GNAT family acetyltransferase
MDSYTVVNNDTEKQFEITTEGEKAYLVYRFHKGDIAFMHTFVPKALEGKGLAETLVKAAFAYAETHKMPVMNYCPYVSVFLKRHPDYTKFLDPQYR